MNINMDYLMTRITDFLVTYGTKIIMAIILWFIGLWLVKLISRAFDRILKKSKTDISLRPFLNGIVNISLKILLGISIFSTLGIKMTSFVAILGAGGLSIGMALSGTMQNFAGGVMILIFKPFKVGDVIDAQGYFGSVSEIQIFNTILKTPDNKTIIIPNGGLSTSSMTNFSTEEKRRVDWTVGVAYGTDLDKAKEILIKLCENDNRILKNPEIFIAVAELADSSVNFALRVWVKASDYWGVFFDMNENIYKAFEKEGINIPFPQMDVHLDALDKNDER